MGVSGSCSVVEDELTSAGVVITSDSLSSVLGISGVIVSEDTASTTFGELGQSCSESK